MLILGGSIFQLPVILRALKLGHRVITVDYVPHNPGHRLAHEYYNVSTTDHRAVLTLARKLRIDGIIAFASDPAAWTAAYVADQMGLPGCPPAAVHVLTNKALFRAFLRDHGFNTPGFAVAADLPEACEVARSMGLPVMVKPADSSGSKGVSRVDNAADMGQAFRNAQHYSRSASVIVEQWIARDSAQIAGDGVVVDGKLAFTCLGDEHFDSECSAYAPVGESFPGHLAAERRETLLKQLQRLMALLGIDNLVFNLDAMFDNNGDLWLIEIGPRAGGNCLPLLIQHHTGVDMADIVIMQSLGAPVTLPFRPEKPPGFHASWMIHSRSPGKLRGLRMAPHLNPYTIDMQLTTSTGATVSRFTSSKDILGYALFTFPSAAEMEGNLACMATSLEPIVA